jgi:acyl-CoA oxidase
VKSTNVCQVLSLCRELRGDAIALIDAFNLPDFVMNSPFGRYDGDVYVNYFARVVARNPPTHPPPYFETVIKPLLQREVGENGEPEDETDTVCLPGTWFLHVFN